MAAAAPGAEEGPAAMAVSESQLKKMLTKVMVRLGAPIAPSPAPALRLARCAEPAALCGGLSEGLGGGEL